MARVSSHAMRLLAMRFLAMQLLAARSVATFARGARYVLIAMLAWMVLSPLPAAANDYGWRDEERYEARKPRGTYETGAAFGRDVSRRGNQMGSYPRIPNTRRGVSVVENSGGGTMIRNHERAPWDYERAYERTVREGHYYRDYYGHIRAVR